MYEKGNLKAFDLGAQTVSIRSSTEETHVFDKEHCQELRSYYVKCCAGNL